MWVRVRRAQTSAGIGGGGAAFDPSEASDAAYKAIVVADAEVGVRGGRYLSAEVDVTGDSMWQYLSATLDLISRLHGSKPVDQGSAELELTVDIWRIGGADNGLK